MNDNELSLDQQIRNKNKKKLIQQNLKLIAQLKHLQVEIEAFDDTLKETKQESSALIALKNETEAQQRQIKKLKDQIEEQKHANIKENVMYIRKEEDQLVFLKKQLENLEIQKNLVLNSHKDKLKKLTNNQPLQKHKQQIQNLWAKTKKQNRQLNLKMVQMEREVRKYHKLKQFSKGPQNELLDSNQSQIMITTAEIDRLNNQMKDIETKWKSNIQQLDKQFFAQKNTLTICQQKIQILEREQQIWRRRAGTLRDKSQLESDRARLSKVISIKNTQETKANSIQNKKKKAIYNNVKDDLQRIKKVNRVVRLAASLTRAESSPNPPTSNKHSVLNDLLIKSKKQDRYSNNKEKSQTSLGLINLQKVKELKLKQIDSSRKVKNLENKAKQSLQEDKKLSIKEQIRKQNEKMSHREKHRTKSSAVSQLGEQLKRKADQVKQLNKKLQFQEVKIIKGRKSRNKQIKMQISQLQASPKNGKSKTKVQKQAVYKQVFKNQPHLKKQSSHSSISKDKLEGVKSIQKNKKIKFQVFNGEQSRQRQKQLIVSLQLKNKKEQKQVFAKNKIKTFVKNQNAITNKQKIVESSPQSQNFLTSPKSLQRKQIQTKLQQKSKLQVQKILKPQLQKHKAEPTYEQNNTKISLQIQLQDQEQGKPKIIKRRRPVQANLVTTGTST